MPKKAAADSASLLLPPCDGPKLGPFRHRNLPIQWHEKLDRGEDDEGTAEGFVFRATIKEHEYAIKVFKFYDPMTSEYFWGPLMGEDTPLDTAAYYTDPFYAECRAYGRMHEAARKKIDDITTKCYGYLFLQPEDHAYLKEQNIYLELDKVNLQYQRNTVGGCKARALVKELVDAEPGLNSGNLGRTIQGIGAMNKCGIYNMDVRLGNFGGGRIVDFGSSWTEPHKLLDALDEKSAEESRLADRVMFDQMVRDEGIPNKNGMKAMHPMKLRRRGRHS